jgi:Tol biopolymer transport system component
VVERRPYWRPRVSPDGSRVAVEVRNDRNELHPWIIDLTDGSAAPLPTGGTINDFYAWTPDGRSLIYRSVRPEGSGIYRQPADGSGAAQLLLAATEDVMVGDVSRDGVLVFASGEQTARRSILTMRLDDGKAVEYLATPAMEHMPAFSPDGRWIAYASNETGRLEVYIRSYPPREGLVRQVSEGGGTAPVWAPDGSELYFRNEAGMLVAVPVRLGEGITTSRPRELFRVQGRFRTSGNTAAYDIERTARRFIMVT